MSAKLSPFWKPLFQTTVSSSWTVSSHYGSISYSATGRNEITLAPPTIEISTERIYVT